jgi:hypothetical protein
MPRDETRLRRFKKKKRLETASRRSRPRPHPRQDRDKTETLKPRDETRPRRSKKRLKTETFETETTSLLNRIVLRQVFVRSLSQCNGKKTSRKQGRI